MQFHENSAMFEVKDLEMSLIIRCCVQRLLQSLNDEFKETIP